MAGLKASDLSIFKMFRVLRTLRIVSVNEGLKTAVLSLIMAIPNIVSIILIVFLFYIIFGILGISYFKGLFFSCTTKNSLNLVVFSKWDCLNAGEEWINSPFNFDNIFSSVKTLIQVSSRSYWSYVMHDAVSITKYNYVHDDYNKLAWSLYFVIFMIVGSFFLLNMFVGVVIVRY